MLRANARIRLEATHDPLTGLSNRRSIEGEVAQLETDGTPYSIAFADIDHFKQLNDEYGHDMGDLAIRAFARTLTDLIRPDDLASRWGGEEFLLVLPGCRQAEALETMARVQRGLAEATLDKSEKRVTVCIGVAEKQVGDPFAGVVARADDAMRWAKASGRNRTVGWEPDLARRLTRAIPA